MNMRRRAAAQRTIAEVHKERTRVMEQLQRTPLAEKPALVARLRELQQAADAAHEEYRRARAGAPPAPAHT
jgi:hypothetical protein